MRQGAVSESVFQEILPTTLIRVNDSLKSLDDVLSLLLRFKDTDDVYSDHFQDHLVLQAPAGQQHAQMLITTLQKTLYFKHIFQASESNLPPGPYFLSEDGIHQAWRLYEDNLDAFIIPTIPESVTAPEK